MTVVPAGNGMQKTNNFGFAIHRESTDDTDNLVGCNRAEKFVVSIKELVQPSQVEKVCSEPMNRGVKTTCRHPMYSHINDFYSQHLNTHSNKYDARCWGATDFAP